MYQRACAFLAALFDATASVLRGDPDAVAKPEELPPIDLDEDVASLAAQFRTYMNAGTTMTAHGRFRTEFYAKVVDRAQKVVRVLADFLPRWRNVLHLGPSSLCGIHKSPFCFEYGSSLGLCVSKLPGCRRVSSYHII